MLALALLFVLFGAAIIATPDPMRPGCWPSPISFREVAVHDVDVQGSGVFVHLVSPDVPTQTLVRWVAATAAVGAVEGLQTVDIGNAFGELSVGVH